MPELPVKEVRLPELRLPEIDRDQIVSSLSGLRLPSVDISTIERPRFGRSQRESGFDLRTIDWRAIDLGPAIAGATALVRVGSRARPLVRSRWVVVVGVVVVVGAATAAVLASPAGRKMTDKAVRGVRARVDRSSDAPDRLEIDADLGDIEPDVETIAEDVVSAVGDVEAKVKDPAETIGTAG
jgi:hypothetical protein